MVVRVPPRLGLGVERPRSSPNEIRNSLPWRSFDQQELPSLYETVPGAASILAIGGVQRNRLNAAQVNTAGEPGSVKGGLVASCGLLGVAALIPAGGAILSVANQADRCGSMGRAALREINNRRLLDATPTTDGHGWVTPDGTSAEPDAPDVRSRSPGARARRTRRGRAACAPESASRGLR